MAPIETGSSNDTYWLLRECTRSECPEFECDVRVVTHYGEPTPHLMCHSHGEVLGYWTPWSCSPASLDLGGMPGAVVTRPWHERPTRVGGGSRWFRWLGKTMTDQEMTELTRLRRVEQAVKDACQHDRDCEEEGEGECCYTAWRRVAIVVGEARNLTAEEQAWAVGQKEGGSEDDG